MNKGKITKCNFKGTEIKVFLIIYSHFISHLYAFFLLSNTKEDISENVCSSKYLSFFTEVVIQVWDDMRESK